MQNKEQDKNMELQRTGQDKDTRPTRLGDRNTYSATSTGRDKDSDWRGEKDNEPAKTIGQEAESTRGTGESNYTNKDSTRANKRVW